MNWELRIIEGQAAGYRKIITKPERLLVGRDASCDLCIPDPLLSRQHCLLEFSANDFKLTDLGSRNGTFVNGQKIQETRLTTNDKIRVGKHILEIIPAEVAATEEPVSVSQILTCAQCGQRIPTADLKEMRAIRHGGKCYCAKCVSQGIELSAISRKDYKTASMKKTTIAMSANEPLAAVAPLTGSGISPTMPMAVKAAVSPRAHKRIGQYEVIDTLGEGGMGVVYKARHTFLETVVAIKVIKEEMVMHADIVKRFLQEAKLGISLDHPHIIRIQDAGEYENVYFISMEYFESQDAHFIVKKTGPMPCPEVLRIALQMTDALDYAHKRGVIHRDVKPSNILINKAHSFAKLADFGLAKAWQTAGANHLTASGQTLGTIQYISPEQLEDSRNVSPQADIFSLGASIYYALAGFPPFGEDPIGKVIQNILHHDPAPLKNVSSDFETIIAKSLAKKTAERFATMEQFNKALQTVKA
jgi:pSer/pThr/pTyr-binding forkhead associated (FHA) protein/tRNA A-37 threonylcarbamoyl transferase component Bud32